MEGNALRWPKNGLKNRGKVEIKWQQIFVFSKLEKKATFGVKNCTDWLLILFHEEHVPLELGEIILGLWEKSIICH